MLDSFVISSANQLLAYQMKWKGPLEHILVEVCIKALAIIHIQSILLESNSAHLPLECYTVLSANRIYNRFTKDFQKSPTDYIHFA